MGPVPLIPIIAWLRWLLFTLHYPWRMGAFLSAHDPSLLHAAVFAPL